MDNKVHNDYSCNYLNKLTLREKEVFLLRVEGKSCKQIAADLHVAKCTVKKHLENIHRKLGVSSQVELIKLIYDGTNN